MADETSRDLSPTAVPELTATAAGEIETPPATLVDDLAAEAMTVPTTGTATPFEMDPEQRSNSLKVSLADMCARATALYAHKSYEEAAEAFAQAAEMQAEMNGEMSPENAEILFLYGRALFKVGQSHSDVLGGKAPEAKKTKTGKKAAKSGGRGANGSAVVQAENPAAGSASEQTTEADRVVEEAVAIIASETSGAKKVDETLEGKKPLFQFTGDENFDDSDEEEVGFQRLLQNGNFRS